MLNINGNWKYYPYSLRTAPGWCYPCYFCNTLTSFSIKYEEHLLWTCYNCIDPKMSIKKLFRTNIFYSCDIGEYEPNSPDITLLTSVDSDEEDDTK